MIVNGLLVGMRSFHIIRGLDMIPSHSEFPVARRFLPASTPWIPSKQNPYRSIELLPDGFWCLFVRVWMKWWCPELWWWCRCVESHGPGRPTVSEYNHSSHLAYDLRHQKACLSMHNRKHEAFDIFWKLHCLGSEIRLQGNMLVLTAIPNKMQHEMKKTRERSW
jgi:hypothetical protein